MQVQRTVLVQEQRLKLSPQLLQSLKVMELPIMELRERIEEEIDRNPALELLEDRGTVSLDEAVKPREEYEYFEVTSDSGYVTKGGEAAADEQRRFIEGALSRPETLQQHLLNQFSLEPVDDKIRRIGELLIQNLNDDGFHKEPVDLLLKNENAKDTEKAIKIIQALDPHGTCTCGYRESLEVQIRLLHEVSNRRTQGSRTHDSQTQSSQTKSPETESPADDKQQTENQRFISKMIEALEYLELLERSKISEVARKLECSEDEVLDIFEALKPLSPFPGRSFASADVRYVVPDIQVVRQEGEFVIILNDVEIPVLGLNPFFMKMSVKKEERQVRDFARENIREARWFIDAVNQRNHTLLRVCRTIVEFQRSFFMYGPKHLAPLTLRDIAGELGVHETTVSRTANGKYVQTEWGIFEIRYFFTNSISGAGSGGSKYSKGGVKEVIREMISGENNHFSDQEIADLLAKRGINLARRTVAKYRKELDLGSSYKR